MPNIEVNTSTGKQRQYWEHGTLKKNLETGEKQIYFRGTREPSLFPCSPEINASFHCSLKPLRVYGTINQRRQESLYEMIEIPLSLPRTIFYYLYDRYSVSEASLNPIKQKNQYCIFDEKSKPAHRKTKVSFILINL